MEQREIYDALLRIYDQRKTDGRVALLSKNDQRLSEQVTTVRNERFVCNTNTASWQKPDHTFRVSIGGENVLIRAESIEPNTPIIRCRLAEFIQRNS